MSTVEIETGNIIKRYAFWNPATWSIPKLYWDAWSQEQRLHAICRQLEKVIAYADYLGVNVDDIASRLKAIEDGQLNDFIVAAIEEWFEDNEPAIITAIEALNDALPITDYDSVNTVTKKIDDEIATVNSTIDDVKAVMPYSSFDSVNTIENAIQSASNDIKAVMPYSSFDSVNTIESAIQSVSDDLNDYIENTEKINSFYNEDLFEVYLNGTDGNDANDGSNDAHAVKTLDRALEIINNKGFACCAIRIRADGTYIWPDRYCNISNTTLHMTAGSVTTSVTILFNTLARYYNSYIHSGAVTGTNFEFIYNAGIHVDACSFYMSNCKFVYRTRFDFSYSFVDYIDCEIDTTKKLAFYQSNVLFQNTNKITSTETSYAIHACQSNLVFYSVLNFVLSAPSYTNFGLIRSDESQTNMLATTITITKPNTLQVFMSCQRSFCTVNGTTASNISSNFDNLYSGSYSIIKTNSSNTIINS